MSQQEDQIDKIVSQWRQGDIIQDHQLSQEIIAALNGLQEKAAPIVGWILTSRTCDIVRQCTVQPFFQVCAIVKAASKVAEAKKRKSPRFAYVPALANGDCVADLAITYTLKKERLLRISRTDSGFDHEDLAGDQSTWISRFQAALSRHKARYAFPDNFNAFKKALGDSLKKALKTQETRPLILAIEELSAEVEINDDKVIKAHVWVILDDDPADPLSDEKFGSINSLMGNIFGSLGSCLTEGASFRVVTQDDLSLRDYRKSHPIDFEDVS